MKRIKAIIVTMIILVFVGGCSRNNKGNYYDESEKNDIGTDVEEGVDNGGGFDGNEEVGAVSPTIDHTPSEQKIIKTYSLDVETKEFDGLLIYINRKIEKYGGYIESSNVRGKMYTSQMNLRDANVVARIPKDKAGIFIDGIGEESNIIYKSEDSENVTLAYVDANNRKKSLEIQQDRLLDMLEKAKNLSEMLTLEEHLNQVRYQLENYTSEIRVYDDKINFSTITMDINEVERMIDVSYKNTVGNRIKNGFVENSRAAGRGIVNIFVSIIVNLPFFALIVITVGIAYLVLRVVIKFRKKRK